MAWRPFFRVWRYGTKLAVRVDTLLQVGQPSFDFTSERGNEVDAELLTRRLQTTFADLVSAARTEAYERGYRDGRGRRAKCPPSYSMLGRDMP